MCSSQEVTIISQSGDIESLSPLLFSQGYRVNHYASIETLALDGGGDPRVAVIDMPFDMTAFSQLAVLLHWRNSDIRIIVGCDSDDEIPPAQARFVWKMLAKPLSARELLHAVALACQSHDHEDVRCVERAPAWFEAELRSKGHSWSLETRNISPRGMQAVCLMPDDSDETRNIGRAVCRLFFDAEHKDFIDVPVELRYITPAQDTRQSILMGFEFWSLSEHLETILANIWLRARQCFLGPGVLSSRSLA